MELPVHSTNSTTTNSTTMTTTVPQSSSHLFQNASGFDIVGGQFVLGDVHNHSAGPSPGHSVPPNDSDEAFSDSEIYCSHLLRQKRGVPLYVPEPHSNLPEAYRRDGIALGDVGRVTPEGIFDFFFNVFLPPEHPTNLNRTPDDFSPMLPYDLTDIIHHSYGPGDYVASSTVQKVELDDASGEFPGGHFVFSCDGPQGAILALPDGAHVQKLENVENMRTYAAKHADSWYRYINGARGRGLSNGDLYLVTGCEKARSWGMASYCTFREEFELSFKPTARPGSTYTPYRWSGIHGRRNSAKKKSHDPISTNDPVNQTIFLHGLSISLGTGLWRRLFGTVTVETSSIADFRLKMNASGSAPTDSQGSWFSWSWNILGGSTTGAKRHAGENGDIIFSNRSPIAKVFNPAKVINEFILHSLSEATVVMSHDDDWCRILGNNFDLSLSEFFQRLNKQFTITDKNGATFLVSKPASPETLRAPGKRRIRGKFRGFGFDFSV
ncbi:hypothetical protein DFH06DRAFT_91349 [Mycena polygramma]|nr:hypothetical protein DFH06DRAFT_91349 [Mycena polygramma]